LQPLGCANLQPPGRVKSQPSGCAHFLPPCCATVLPPGGGHLLPMGSPTRRANLHPPGWADLRLPNAAPRLYQIAALGQSQFAATRMHRRHHRCVLYIGWHCGTPLPFVSHQLPWWDTTMLCIGISGCAGLRCPYPGSVPFCWVPALGHWKLAPGHGLAAPVLWALGTWPPVSGSHGAIGPSRVAVGNWLLVTGSWPSETSRSGLR
jgi:hypothetical protein